MKATKRDIYQQLITVPMNPDDHYLLVKMSRDIQQTRKIANERITANWIIRAMTQPRLVAKILENVDTDTCHNEEVFHKRILELITGLLP